MRIIGHRGASHVAPENTLASVRLALSHGCGFEVDIQTLSCGTLVVLHDDTLERTTLPDPAPLSRALARRPIEELRWVDVKDVDVGSWFGAGFSAERLPLFSDVLHELVEAYAVHASVVGSNGDEAAAPHCFAELKASEPFDPSLPGRAAAAVAAANVPADALTWISFSLPLVVEMKRRTPQYAGLHIADCRTSEAAWAVARECVRCGLDGIDLRALDDVVSTELIEWLHARGKTVAVWVSRAPGKEDTRATWDVLESRGVDDFTSNLPPDIREWRSQRSRASDASAVLHVAAGVTASYALVRVAAGERVAEDAIDLAHSCVATAVSARVAATSGVLDPLLRLLGPMLGPMLGPSATPASASTASTASTALTLRGPPDRLARLFVLASSSYFACDVALVLGSLASGSRPRQAFGRLAHHAVQAAANLPALLCAPPAASAVRRYLLLAYAAGGSTICCCLPKISHDLPMYPHALPCAPIISQYLPIFPNISGMPRRSPRSCFGYARCSGRRAWGRASECSAGCTARCSRASCSSASASSPRARPSSGGRARCCRRLCCACILPSRARASRSARDGLCSSSHKSRRGPCAPCRRCLGASTTEGVSNVKVTGATSSAGFITAGSAAVSSLISAARTTQDMTMS